MRTYETVREDWEELFSHGSAYDMTGGYEDQVDLDRLLKSPTKRTAKECMLSQIHYWFEVGPDVDASLSGAQAQRDRLILENEKVRDIAERYGYA